MSYTVLARKWRPRNFAEMAGQEHVRRALVNALDGDRLHHAFLFSGTRGVGKTTVARILAKCLNCEKGISSEPCGECSNCREIDEGRFVDLIEVDAASRTKVDDTRELLDNVQYKPTRGAFKVYLIDEVHMLSKHSFNALLKTLEEPPEHVKFLLATTDPQKLPVTVLSRCLQFNLKKLPVDLIAERLQSITNSEEVAAEEAALARIARAANGSMRDGLSLLDQAIAYGDGALTDDEVLTMLGSIDRREIAKLVQTVIAGDARGVMQCISAMDEHAPDYDNALVELASVIQRAALAKAVPDAIDDSLGDRELALALAKSATAEELQLYYQIALIGRRDLYLAANPRGGFEMVLLRMLAFRPAGAGDTLGQVQPVAQSATIAGTNNTASSAPSSAPPRAKSSTTASAKTPAKSAARSPSQKPEKPAAKKRAAPAAVKADDRHDDVSPDSPGSVEPDSVKLDAGNLDWKTLVEKLEVRGAARQLAANCVFGRREGQLWHLTLDKRHEHLLTDQLRDRLTEALQKLVGSETVVRIRIGTPADATPAAQKEQEAEVRLDAAREEIEKDPNVKALKDLFDATVLEDSIRPTGSGDSSK